MPGAARGEPGGWNQVPVAGAVEGSGGQLHRQDHQGITEGNANPETAVVLHWHTVQLKKVSNNRPSAGAALRARWPPLSVGGTTCGRPSASRGSRLGVCLALPKVIEAWEEPGQVAKGSSPRAQMEGSLRLSPLFRRELPLK